MTPNEQAVRAQMESSERIPPGTEGWWQVWGATGGDIRPGDVIATVDHDNAAGLIYDEVAAVEHQLTRVCIIKPDGSKFTMGQLFKGFAVLRYGTHHTLAGSVR